MPPVFMKGSMLGVVFLAACSGLGTPELAPFGFLQVVTRSSFGQPATYPQATFMNAVQSGYPNSRDTTNACVPTDLASGGASALEPLDAGDSVAFTGDGGTTYLYPAVDLLGNVTYQPRVASVPMTPGTGVTFDIPGASDGFPAASLSALTPPPILEVGPNPIPTSVAAADSMVVTWAPVGDDSSRMEIALQFGAAGVPTLNRQVLCRWRDDGRGVIAGNLLSEWSGASQRRVQMTRFRTARQVLGSGPVLYFIGSYDTLPPLP